MKSRAPNRLEQAITAGATDVSRRPAMLRLQLEEPLWFPVEFRAGSPPVIHPAPGEHLAVWICTDDDGPFVPAFTARDVMKQATARFSTRHTVATMKGRDFCAAMSRQEHAIVLNPSCKYLARLPLPVLRALLSGDIFKPGQGQASLRMLKPEQLPSGLLQVVFDECHAEPGILGLWLADPAAAPDAPVDLKKLHAALWLAEAGRTPIDHLNAALRRAVEGGELQIVRFDEDGSAAALADLRQFPALYLRPAPPPG